MKNSNFDLDSVQDQRWEGNMTLNHPSALLILVQNETVPSLPRHNSYTPGWEKCGAYRWLHWNHSIFTRRNSALLGQVLVPRAAYFRSFVWTKGVVLWSEMGRKQVHCTISVRNPWSKVWDIISWHQNRNTQVIDKETNCRPPDRKKIWYPNVRPHRQERRSG